MLVPPESAVNGNLPDSVADGVKALDADLHIACTGTPVENRLLDLWNLCDVLQRGLLGSAREFVESDRQAD